MDSFELNKILGAILTTLLVVMGIGIFSDTIFATHAPQKSAYELPAESADGAAAGGGAAAPQVNLAELVGKGDAGRGAGVAKQQCGACHTFDKGGKSGIGPNLFGIVERGIGGTAGFAYSPVFQGKAKEGGKWSFESLYAFLSSPRAFANGTKMAYGGLKDPGRMGDLMAYLRSIADTPAALPAAQP
ncbi:MAG: c-type cytochrome [Alphaproteobacteria bacterium]|nr:c-type cytochrome [Alphaproteobacteria bacterium]